MDNDCERTERLISERLDGEISPADELTLETHLSRCEECRRFAESARSSRAQLRALPDVAIDARASGSSERIAGKSRFWNRRISISIPVAAAMAVLMLTGWLLALLPGSEPAKNPPRRQLLAHSVEIIKAQPAEVGSIQTDPDNSPTKKGGDL